MNTGEFYWFCLAGNGAGDVLRDTGIENSPYHHGLEEGKTKLAKTGESTHHLKKIE